MENKVPVDEKLPPFACKWFICTTQTDYCVLDGSTILYAGRKVRLADIDAPAIAEARCEAERSRGGDAKLRLREILNEGDVTLVAAKGNGGNTSAGIPTGSVFASPRKPHLPKRHRRPIQNLLPGRVRNRRSSRRNSATRNSANSRHCRN